MAKRMRMTEMEAYAVKTRQSEPVGSRGNGTLLLERKASGAILAYFRERTAATDKRLLIGALSRAPRSGANEFTLSAVRAQAMRIATEVELKGGLAKYIEFSLEQDEAQERENIRLRQQAEIAARRGTLGDLMDSYVSSLEKAGQVSAKGVKSLFTLHVKTPHPLLIQRAAAEIEPEDIQLVLAGVLRRQPTGRGKGNKSAGSSGNGMRTTCDKLRSYLRAAFGYAAKAHLAPERLAEEGKTFAIRSNPVRDIPVTQGTGEGHTESLSPAELGELLRHLDTLPERYAAIAKTAIYLGGQRLAQLCAIPWENMSDTTFSLLDAKGRKAQAWEHLLPITERVREIIKPLLNDPMGPGPFSLTPNKTIHPATLSVLFSDAGNILAAAGKTQRFTWRNIRVTAETLLAHQGVSLEVRAWLLSHGRSGVQAKHYDRYSYLPEKQAALEQWGRYLDGLASGEVQADNVVLLSRRPKKTVSNT